MQSIYVLSAYPIYIDFDHRMIASEKGLKERNSNFTDSDKVMNSKVVFCQPYTD